MVVTCDYQRQSRSVLSSSRLIGGRQAQQDLHQLPEGTAITKTRLPDFAIVLEAPLQGSNRLGKGGVGWFD